MPLEFLPVQKRHLKTPTSVVFDTCTVLGDFTGVVFDTCDPVFRAFLQPTGVVYGPHLHYHLPALSKPVHEGSRMGMRRIKKWERLKNRSRYDYLAVPDDDLLAMKSVARSEAVMFMVDGRGMFLEVLRLTGLAGINDELWKRGLTPAQRGEL